MERYLEWVAPSYAPTTLSGQRYKLKFFLQYCEVRDFEVPGEMTQDKLQAFCHWLEETFSWGPVTRSNVVQVARRFLLWAYEAGETLWDFSDFSLPYASSPRPEIPTIEVMKKLLSLPDLATALGQRDQVLLELLYVLGLRRCECSTLNMSDLDFSQAQVRVTGKGYHERLVPLSPSVVCSLKFYLANGRQLLLGDKNEDVGLNR